MIHTCTCKDTLRPILKRAAWSLTLALWGRRPSPSLASESGFEVGAKSVNMPVEMSMKFALAEIRGDWQWHVFQFELWQSYWKCGAICHRCRAARLPRFNVIGASRYV